MTHQDRTLTYVVPAGAGSGVWPIALSRPDLSELEAEAWTSGSDGIVNLLMLADDVPLAEAQARVAGALATDGRLDALFAIPPGSSARAPIPEEARHLTLFWDAAPAQAFAVTIRIRYKARDRSVHPPPQHMGSHHRL